MHSLRLDSTHDTYPDVDHALIASNDRRFQLERCTVAGQDLDMWVQLDIPELRPAGTVYWADKGMSFPAYEIGPGSPLLAFSFHQSIPYYPPAVPLEVGVRNRIPRAVTSTQPETRFDVTVGVFTRTGGERLRSLALTGGTWTVEVGAYPAHNGTMPVMLNVTFPATTCPLQDVAESLQDVPLRELAAPGSHAREKDVVVRMLCGADAPRARLTLHDAGDASNTGSTLTPTADSDAEGVRIELLRGGREVAFGTRWDFDPGVGGVHDHVFTARYLRMPEDPMPGIIRGEAVLEVDYW